eukprot:9502666-Pyramimonas_sp.AAC.2
MERWESCFGPPVFGPIAVTRHPLPVGTITAAQAQWIWRQTWCKACVRDRGRGGGREIVVTGRSSLLQYGYNARLQFVSSNGPAGGRQVRDFQVSKVAPRSVPMPDTLLGTGLEWESYFDGGNLEMTDRWDPLVP